MDMDIGRLTNWVQIAIWIGTAIRLIWKWCKVGNISMVSKLHQLWSADKFLTTLITLGILSSIFSLYLFFVKPPWEIIISRPKVYEPFESVYKEHKTKLGKPIRNVIKDDHVYEAAHEHAIVIYIESLTAFYRLENTTSKWTKYPDAYWEYSDWFNDKWLRRHFSTPKGFNPPFGGVAKNWERDKTKWSWIGWRIWHCYLHGIYYQKFEHGIIMGNFLLHPETKEAGTVFVLFANDFRWEASQGTAENTPICITPLSE